jgi:iron complex transport system ATP-binding protein
MLLAVSHLGVCYGRQTALADISLTLAAGEVVALLGPNGSGKSTLLRALLGQLPATGSIEWHDRPLAKWPARELAREVAYLAQTPGWEPQQTVGDTLRLGRAPYLRPFGIESKRDIEVIGEVTQRLELGALLTRSLDSLSGGQRQRVFVARGLVQEPKVLLLDEPNTHLDLKHQVELGELLVSLSRTQGLAVLMASHDLNLAGAFADRLLLLKGGKLAANGTPNEVLRPEILQPVYGVNLMRVETGSRRTPLLVPIVDSDTNKSFGL